MEDLVLLGVMVPEEVLAMEHNPGANHWQVSTHMRGAGGRELYVPLSFGGGELGTYAKELVRIVAPALLVFVSQAATPMRRLNLSVRLPMMLEYSINTMEQDLAHGIASARAALRDAGAHVPDLALLTTPMTKSKTLGSWVDMRCDLMAHAAALQDRMDAIVEGMRTSLAAIGSPEVAAQLGGAAEQLRALMREHHRLTASMLHRITDC